MILLTNTFFAILYRMLSYETASCSWRSCIRLASRSTCSAVCYRFIFCLHQLFISTQLMDLFICFIFFFFFGKLNYRISLNTMTLQVESPTVYTSQGVPISVTGIAQVKIQGQNEDMLLVRIDLFFFFLCSIK